MSVGTLLAPQTELQPWSSLYANSLHVETLVADSLTVDGNLAINGNLSVTGTSSLYTLDTSGPITAGGVLNMSGHPIINAGSISSGSISASGSISSSGTITASGQSLAYYTSPPSATQVIPNNSITQVTLLSDNISSKGADITINPAGPLITFNTLGYYSISIGLQWIQSGFITGAATVYFNLIDTVSLESYLVAAQPASIGGRLALTGSIVAPFAAGQTLGLYVYQNSGGNETLGSGLPSPDSFVSVYRLVA
jgi:hypothetical protein